MRIARWKTFFCTLSALCACGATFLCLYGARVCRLSAIDGNRTFYLYTPSSQATQTEKLSFSDIFYVKGESVRFDLHGTEQEKQALVQEILKAYGAELVETESCSGTVSYYAYAPELLKGVYVNGKQVNLHIAVGESQAAVGTPIIFGGF